MGLFRWLKDGCKIGIIAQLGNSVGLRALWNKNKTKLITRVQQWNSLAVLLAIVPLLNVNFIIGFGIICVQWYIWMPFYTFPSRYYKMIKYILCYTITIKQDYSVLKVTSKSRTQCPHLTLPSHIINIVDSSSCRRRRIESE